MKLDGEKACSGRLRIAIVDDHRVVLAGLRLLIETRPDCEVVGEATDRAGAMALAALAPDVVILDLDLGGESALEFLPDLVRASPRSRIVVLTALRDVATHLRALKLGAIGLVLKDRAPGELLAAIDHARDGEYWLAPELAARLVRDERPAPDPLASTTPREREIARLIADGLRNKEVARRLGLSETTVRHHLTSVYAKLGVRDRLELALHMHRLGLLEPPR